MGDSEQSGATPATPADRAAPPAPGVVGEDQQVDIHKPKAVHGWREFVGEVGIIVIGVLIALSAEQIVEAVHWRHKVEAVSGAVRHELGEDDLPQAYARVVIARCVSRQLDGLRGLATPGADGGPFLKSAIYYRPPARTWDADAQRLAEQSDLAAHLTTDQIDAIAQPYRYVAKLKQYAELELAHQRALQLSRYGSGTLSRGDANQISDTLDALQFDNKQIAALSYALLNVGRSALAVDLPSERKHRILAEAHEVYGDCATEFAPPNALGDRQIRKPTGKGLYEGLDS